MKSGGPKDLSNKIKQRTDKNLVNLNFATKGLVSTSIFLFKDHQGEHFMFDYRFIDMNFSTLLVKSIFDSVS